MELSCKMYHVNGGVQNQFIFKLSIVKNLDQFNVLLELYSLFVQDEPTLNIVIDHVSKRPNDNTLLRKIDNKLKDSIHLNYYEVESYLPILKNDLTKIINMGLDNNKLFNFTICNKFNVVFNSLQIKRLYSDLYGFYQNYMILDALFKLSIANSNKKPEVQTVNNHIGELKRENNKNEVVKPVIITPDYTQESTKLDDLLNLCINQSMKSFIINLTCNYYIYVGKNHCYIEPQQDSSIINIYSCSLFPNNYVFNNDYIKSLVMSLTTYNINDIGMRFNKLINNCLTDSNNTPLEIMSILGMSYLYCLTYLYHSHSSFLLSNMDNLFIDTTLQSRLINNHIRLYLKTDNIKMFIKDLFVTQMENQDNNKLIDELGKKYHHLIAVSEDSFIEKVLNDMNEITIPCSDKQILINSTRILNLNSLKSLNLAEAKKVQSVQGNMLIDPHNLLDYDIIYSNLFNYDFNNKFLTLSHTYFDEFVQNQSNFILNLKQKKINFKLVPVEVVNLFNVIKQILYDKSSLVITSNNTYVYYKTLIDTINDPTVFSHYTYLFIIYQIIIPFMNLNYNIVEFENTF